MERKLIKDAVAEFGNIVTVSGWIKKIRNHGNLQFLDLCDRSGSLQCVIHDDLLKKEENVQVRIGSSVQIQGEVLKRAKEQINKSEIYGDKEISIKEIIILGVNKYSVYGLNELANEEVRLKQRYLDIRSENMVNILRIKNRVKQHITEYLINKEFVEIEMPTLSIPTPEGARDFLVESNIRKNHYFSLLQSPQLYKQLLMLSPIERYFSFPHCYRNEELRSDRQPEFTQLDVEMAYVNDINIFIQLIQDLIESILKKIFPNLKYSFTSFSYKEALNKYGSDKPRISIYERIKDLSSFFKKSKCNILKDMSVASLVVKIDSSKEKKKISELIEKTIKEKLKMNIAVFRLNSEDLLSGKLVNKLSEDEKAVLTKELTADSILLLNSKDSLIQSKRELLTIYEFLIGEIRGIGKIEDIVKELRFCFIKEIPMFERDANNKLKTKHHPFTKPIMDGKPEEWSSQSFDLVCNGKELLSGSLRINNSDMQRELFKACGISDEDIEKRYAFFLKALDYGMPPHGGFALGFDRLIATLCFLDSIRDVLAFPKNASGKDLLVNAPIDIDYIKSWETI